MLDASSLISFEAKVIKHKLELVGAAHAHLEDLRADVEDHVEQRCELLLDFLCHTISSIFLTHSLELT